MKILQIVPYVAPSISGVGDYALILAHGLRERYGIVTTFAVANPEGAPPEREIEGFKVLAFSDFAGSSLRGIDRLLLHYVGYGYEKRGCPVGLVRTLRKWRSDGEILHLNTIFHELYAFGKPWQSSFWTHPLQKWICREIANLSEMAITNRTESQRILRVMRAGRDVNCLPVFSNIGEPESLPPYEDRQARVVVFGSEGWRRKATGEYLPELLAACKRWGVTEGVEIGPGDVPMPVTEIPWRQLGPLPAAEVSGWLSRSMMGFNCYPSSYLEKSGIFAAYAAHGLATALPDRCWMADTLGIEKGIHVLSPSGAGAGELALEICGAALFDWYQNHRVGRQIEYFANLLKI